MFFESIVSNSHPNHKWYSKQFQHLGTRPNVCSSMIRFPWYPSKNSDNMPVWKERKKSKHLNEEAEKRGIVLYGLYGTPDAKKSCDTSYNMPKVTTSDAKRQNAAKSHLCKKGCNFNLKKSKIKKYQ